MSVKPGYSYGIENGWRLVVRFTMPDGRWAEASVDPTLFATGRSSLETVETMVFAEAACMPRNPEQSATEERG